MQSAQAASLYETPAKSQKCFSSHLPSLNAVWKDGQFNRLIITGIIIFGGKETLIMGRGGGEEMLLVLIFKAM